MAKKVEHFASRLQLKATHSDSKRKVAFVANRDAGMARVYVYKHGDTTPDDDVSIIRPNDGLGRWFQFILGIILMARVIIAASFDATPWRMDVYTNIADMVANASPKSVNKSIRVLGYNSPGDGGGGMFFATNTVASTNSGTRFVSGLEPAYSWDRVMEGGRELNASIFGLYGDDYHDDTTALQNAFTLAQSGKFSTVVLPPGVFKTTGTLYIYGSFILKGSGYVGPTSFSPLMLSGSMIRYYGTTNCAVQVGDGTNYVFHLQMDDIRIGAAGQSPKPVGLYLNNVSESIFDSVQITGGFSTGIRTRGVTLCNFYNSTVEANTIGLTTEINQLGTGFLENVFYGANYYLNDTSFQFSGNTSDLAIRDSWIEDTQTAVYIPPPTNSVVVVRNIQFDNTSINTANRSNGRAFKIDGGSTGNSLDVHSITFRDSMMYVPATNAIDILLTNNTGPSTFCRSINFENIEAYNITNSLVYCDWPNAGMMFSGQMKVVDGFGGGSSKPMLAGQGRYSVMLQNTLGILDWSGGGSNGDPWRLPSGSVLSFMDGLFGYDMSQHKPYWYNGSAVRYVAAVDSSNTLLASITTGTAMQKANGSGGLTAATAGTDFANSGQKLSYFATTSSSELAGVISDETGTGSLVFGSSPTIVTPTIASFANANHNHTNVAGGGTLDASAIASGTIATSRLGSGTANSSTFLRGDSTWASPSGGTINVQEQDGSPNVSGVTTIKVSNGTLTDNTGGVVSIVTGGGGISTRTGITREQYFTPKGMDIINTGGGTLTAGTYTIPATAHTLSTLDFATPSTTGYAGFTWSPPDTWNLGSIKIRVYWTATAGTASQGVAWVASASSQNDGTSIAVTSGSTVIDNLIGTDTLHISPSFTITPSGTPATGDMIIIRLARNTANGSDTLAATAKVLGVKIQYTESSTEPTPWP